MARAIPTIERIERLAPMPAAGLEPASNSDLPCSGRCGHCECHPCQLHAPI